LNFRDVREGEVAEGVGRARSCIVAACLPANAFAEIKPTTWTALRSTSKATSSGLRTLSISQAPEFNALAVLTQLAVDKLGELSQ
jgi:hypothetical protein